MLKDMVVGADISSGGAATSSFTDHSPIFVGQRWVAKGSKNEITITKVDGLEVCAVSPSGDRRMLVESLRKNYAPILKAAALPAEKNPHEMLTVTVRMTPEIAAAFHDNMAPNRGISLRKVEALKHDMLNGKYELTHQSIAFNKTGQLIDGQHRVVACRDSGIAVLQRVTFYPGSRIAALIEAAQCADTSDLRIGSPIDRGLVRGIAGQIEVANRGTGQDKSRADWIRIEAITKAINFLRENKESFGESKMVVPPITEAIVESSYALYQREIDWILSRTNCKFNSSVAAVIALAFGPFPDQMEKFLTQVVSGENIPTGGPAGRLRNAASTFKRSSGNQGRLRLMLAAAHGARLFIGNKKIKGKGQLKPASDAAVWLFDARTEARLP